MIGKTLGHYRVGEQLGRGGMGEVYVADDLNLNRKVALKFLPDAFTGDPERMARFEREAKLLASLNHPNIAAIYGLEQAEGKRFLVLELVEGETLAQRLSKGPLSVEEALAVCRQIAEGLEAAHEKGVIHRDLKPANVMITEEDKVKILDFGLAKAMLGEAQTADASQSPTITEAMTQPGIVLGTAAYMSPEQARGKTVDKRADIWAFGVILFEMLSGKNPFQGSDISETLATIIRDEPEWDKTPESIRPLLRMCLQKESKRRLRDIGDAMIWIKNSPKGTRDAAPASGLRWRLAPWVFSGLCLAAVIGSWWMFRSPAQISGIKPRRITWDAGVTSSPAISLDSKLIAYSSDRDGQNNLDLYVQQIPGGTPSQITHTDDDETEPAFSPDGTSIAFSSSRQGGGIYIIPTLGGEPRLLVRGGHTPRYSPDGNLIAYWAGPITSGDPVAEGSAQGFVIPSSGGTPRQIHPEFPVVRWPLWSPDGRMLMFQGVAPGESAEAWNRLDYWVTPVEGGKAQSSGLLAKLRKAGIQGLFFDLTSWTTHGLLFNASSVIYRVRLDGRGRVSGDVTQLTNGMALDLGAAAARDGRMVWASGVQRINIWGLPVDGNGGVVKGMPYRITDSLAPTIHPCLSADGRQLLFDSPRNGQWQIWQRDLATGKELVAVTGRGAWFGYLLRSSGRIAYGASDGSYILDPSTGEHRKITDGWAAYVDIREQTALLRHDTPLPSWDALDLKSGKRTPLLSAKNWPIYQVRLSDDNAWLIFLVQTGPSTNYIYVARPNGFKEIPQTTWFPVTDGRQKVDKPRFSPDGKLIYFTIDHEGSRGIMAVRFNRETGKAIGDPVLVYDFRNPRLSMFPVNLGDLEISIAQDKIVMLLAESNWNIWMAELENS
jgi:serine/threonine protein kinase